MDPSEGNSGFDWCRFGRSWRTPMRLVGTLLGLGQAGLLAAAATGTIVELFAVAAVAPACVSALFFALCGPLLQPIQRSVYFRAKGEVWPGARVHC